jgi:hypothetical protein
VGPLRLPNDPTGCLETSVCLGPPLFSILLFFLLVAMFHSEYISFPHSSSSFGPDIGMGTAVLAVAITAVEAAPGSAIGSIPQTPEGVPEDVLEESEEEPKMVPEPVPEVVPEEVPVEGEMIVVHAVAPSPSHSPPAASSPAPHAAAAVDATASAVVGLEVVMGHPTLYVPDDISLDEAMSMAQGPCLRCSVSCAEKVRASQTSTSSCGPTCSRR